jgi:DNA-directed RNA polymerase specialized sigma24 family protein
VTDAPVRRLDEGALRALVPRVLAGLVRRGEDFDAAEDALQEALLEALRVWPEHPPREPGAWLTTVATRRLVDARRPGVRRSRPPRHKRRRARPPGPPAREPLELVPSAERLIAGAPVALVDHVRAERPGLDQV